MHCMFLFKKSFLIIIFFWWNYMQVEVIISKMILRELQVEVIIKSGTR